MNHWLKGTSRMVDEEREFLNGPSWEVGLQP